MTASSRGAGSITLLAAALAICLAALMACTSTKEQERKVYNQRETALKLIEEGRKIEATAPLVALSRFDRSAKLYETADAYFEMGRLYEAMGKRNEAAAAYNQALKLNPDWREAKYALLALGFETPKAATAEDIKQARQWAAAHPLQPITVAEDETETGGLTAEQIQAKRQDVMKKAADERQPTEAEVAAAIFAPAKEKQQLPSAEKPVYTNKEEFVLGSYPYHLDRARSFAQRGQNDAAIEEYNLAMQIDPKQIEPRLDIGDLMMRQERYPQARFHYEIAGRQFPESPRPNLKLGNLALAMHNRPEAEEYFRKALEKDPKYAEAINNLAVMAMQDKNWAEASRLLDQALAINPDYVNALLNRGIIASDVQHDPATALRMYRRYVELKGPRAEEVKRWIQDLEARGK